MLRGGTVRLQGGTGSRPKGGTVNGPFRPGDPVYWIHPFRKLRIVRIVALDPQGYAWIGWGSPVELAYGHRLYLYMARVPLDELQPFLTAGKGAA